jgi:hypothetical protein
MEEQVKPDGTGSTDSDDARETPSSTESGMRAGLKEAGTASLSRVQHGNHHGLIVVDSDAYLPR